MARFAEGIVATILGVVSSVHLVESGITHYVGAPPTWLSIASSLALAVLLVRFIFMVIKKTAVTIEILETAISELLQQAIVVIWLRSRRAWYFIGFDKIQTKAKKSLEKRRSRRK